MRVALCFCLIFAVVLCDETESENETEAEVYNQNNPLGLKQEKVFYSSLGQTFDLYSSNKEIRNILVPRSETALDVFNYYVPNANEHPPIYFNLYDNGKNEGIYLLKNKTARKIKDGTDCVADYPFNGIDISKDYIYITSSDGIYTYNPKTEAIVKFGSITEEFKAIDKVSNQDVIYVLAADDKIYKITEHGTVKTKVEGIEFAKDFVVDLQGAIYFLGEDNKPQVLYKEGSTPVKVTGLNFDVKKPILGRPLWNWDPFSETDVHTVPFIVDGVSYALVNDSAVVVPCDATVAGLTAFSAEYSFVNFYGEKGHIYMHSIVADNPTTILKRGKAKKRRLVAFNRDVEADFEAFKQLRRTQRKNH